MSTALAVSRLAMGQRSLLESEHEPGAAPRSTGPAREEGNTPRTLERLIVDTWEGLVRGTSRCPVCGGRLEPQFGAHARPVAGRCADCGSKLS